MSNIKYLCVVLSLFLFSDCTVSKMTVNRPLDDSARKAIYDICNYSKTFGQLDTRDMTDTPYHLVLQSGFYNKDHFKISVKAKPQSDSTAFTLAMSGSGGKKFVKGIPKKVRKAFLSEFKTAFPDPVEPVTDTPANATTSIN